MLCVPQYWICTMLDNIEHQCKHPNFTIFTALSQKYIWSHSFKRFVYFQGGLSMLEGMEMRLKIQGNAKVQNSKEKRSLVAMVRLKIQIQIQIQIQGSKSTKFKGEEEELLSCNGETVKLGRRRLGAAATRHILSSPQIQKIYKITNTNTILQIQKYSGSAATWQILSSL